MKKLFYLFAFLTVILSSCSGSTSEENTTTPILITKITREINSVIYTIDFVYNGTKLATETTSNGLVKHYTYTGNYITYIETKNSSNTTTYETFVEYNSNNKISKIINLNHTSSNPIYAGTKKEYTYNSNGTISLMVYTGTITEQNQFGYKSIFYTDSQGQIIKYEDKNINDEIISSYEYTHDIKKSPFINVVGFNQFLFDYFNNSYSEKNNVISSNDILWGSYSSSCSYSYNSSDFPITNTFTDSNGSVRNYQYLYNQ